MKAVKTKVGQFQGNVRGGIRGNGGVRGKGNGYQKPPVITLSN